MDKETILKKSREENLGGMDEWELAIEAKSAKISRVVGLVACMILVFVAAPLLDNRPLAQGAWMVYFSMLGSSDLYMYMKTKKKRKLLWAVLELFCVVGYLVILGLWTRV